MKASKLRHSITIQHQNSTRSSTGALIQDWSDLCVCYCSFEPLSVKDILTAKSINSEIVARCVLRKRNNIDSTMRVVHKNTVYQIEGDPLTDPNSGNEYMTLTLRKIDD